VISARLAGIASAAGLIQGFFAAVVFAALASRLLPCFTAHLFRLLFGKVFHGARLRSMLK